ncbi:MAG: TonB-dependent receptor [Chitinophagaceae bacterium]|nr:MAG: TonB-dependent receptor [Chitinophagaceae bacterium]
MKHFLLTVAFLITAINLSFAGDILKGKVIDSEGNILSGANVYWLSYQKGTATDENGSFSLVKPDEMPQPLVISFVGYTPDTVQVSAKMDLLTVTLLESYLSEIEIKGKNPATYLSKRAAPVQVITSEELTRSACCDLTGCFETNTAVHSSTSNVITSAKELEMLGLDGVYNYQTLDGFPLFKGLSYTYGMSTWPGVFVDEIHISKGSNSVLRGYEGMSGEINFETVSPAKSDKFFLNLYMNNYLEHQANTWFSFGDNNYKGLIGAHYTGPGRETDRNNNGFLDQAVIERYMFVSKNSLSVNRLKWDNTLRWVSEHRRGGETGFVPSQHRLQSEVYGQSISYFQPEFYSRLSWKINDFNTLLFNVSASYHQQESYYGTTSYEAEQTSLFAELRHDIEFNDISELKYGLQFRLQDITQKIEFAETVPHKNYEGKYRKEDYTTGFFAEKHTNLISNRLNLVKGVRIDHHQQFGVNVTPRLLIRYSLLPELEARALIGTAWRSPDFIPENTALLSSGRDMPVHMFHLLPERSLNYGAQLVYNWNHHQLNGYISGEYFFTRFSRMHTPDLDVPGIVGLPAGGIEAYFGNFLFEKGLNINDNIDLKAGYVYHHSARELDDEKKKFDLSPTHKFLAVVSFNAFDNRLKTDANLHIYGKQRLPQLIAVEDENTTGYTKPFAVLNFQIGWSFDKIDVYSGVENVFDFRQKQPILGYENPFDSNFDPSIVWGPVRGREIYAGIRWRPFSN